MGKFDNWEPPAPPRKSNGEAPHKNGADNFEGVLYRRVSEIEPRAINWLWPNRIPRGKLSIIVGNPGLGKSQICASLAAIVSTGGLWPVDRTPAEKGKVIILSAEDDEADTIRPRLEAAGAALENVYILQAIEAEDEKGEKEKRAFSLASDIARLGSLLHSLGNVALVIIDPITAYLGKADSHKNAEVRALLAPLQEMAAAQGTAILAVSHLTKSQGVDALQRVQGSIAFAAAARSVWGVAKDKDNPARRFFLPLKNNVGTDLTGFAYSVEAFNLEGTDPAIETSHVMWDKELVTQPADEVFGQSVMSHDENTELETAKDFLRAILLEGPVPTKQIESDARGAGHSWATVRRAQVALKIEATKDGFRSPWMWRLPDRERRKAQGRVERD